MTASLALGFALGWVGSMPIAGAISFFVCHRGFAGRSGHGLALAAGAAVAEAGWCLAILLGADELMDRWPAVGGVARSIGGLFLVVLGIVVFLRRRGSARRALGKQAGTDAARPLPRLRDETHLGATLVIANPAIPFNWLALITIAISLGLDPGRAPVAFALGVSLGIMGWFSVLLRIITAWRERMNEVVLARVQGGFAMLLIVVGLYALSRAWG